MSNSLEITIYDFDNICRTCLSREDLKPLYEKCSRSTCPAEMLKACTLVKFTEDDGLPEKICTNCIHEINQAFSFTKRCETTDTILRKCVIKCKTELATNSSESQTIEAKKEIILPNNYRTVREVLEDYKFVDGIKQETDVKIEYVEVKKEEELIIENEYDENYDDPVYESFEQDVDEVQNETYSEKADNSGSKLRRTSNNSKIEDENSDEKDGFPSAKKIDLLTKKANLPNQHLSIDIKSDRAFGEKILLKQHSSIHGEKQYVCSVCNKTCKYLSNHKRHMRIHTGEKPYSCGVCGASFSLSCTLNNHKRIHTGEKPNVCSVCNKAFARNEQLNLHMKMHTGVKPYCCEVCNKSFSAIYKLNYHKRIHTGEKPNVCSICSKAFTYKGNLSAHMRVHTVKKFVLKVSA